MTETGSQDTYTTAETKRILTEPEPKRGFASGSFGPACGPYKPLTSRELASAYTEAATLMELTAIARALEAQTRQLYQINQAIISGLDKIGERVGR